MTCRKCGARLASDSIRLGYVECSACQPKDTQPRCANGHDLTVYGTGHVGSWTCVQCRRDYQRDRIRRVRAERKAA
jgi:hypothetical protein